MWDNTIGMNFPKTENVLTKAEIKRAREADARMKERAANALRFLKSNKAERIGKNNHATIQKETV